jgi:hypothetical protein
MDWHRTLREALYGRLSVHVVHVFRDSEEIKVEGVLTSFDNAGLTLSLSTFDSDLRINFRGELTNFRVRRNEEHGYLEGFSFMLNNEHWTFELLERF